MSDRYERVPVTYLYGFIPVSRTILRDPFGIDAPSGYPRGDLNLLWFPRITRIERRVRAVRQRVRDVWWVARNGMPEDDE